ncbi:MAG: hypothetical protein E3J72_07635 [Planctomycetota bacterium]|nr:MAG: hypothetical protein E3J72_07635 [Planctomycetota bacterium]
MRLRLGCLVLVFALTASIAFAEEVTLEPVKAKNPAYSRGREIRCQILTECPEGVKAPEGELGWANLRLGKNNMLLAFADDSEKGCILYVDRDMDKNLAEEEALTGTSYSRQNYSRDTFDLNEMPGLFKVGDTELSLDMSLRIIRSTSKYQGQKRIYYQVSTFTTYQGKIKAFEKDWKITWIPGQDPTLQASGTASYISGYHFGRKRILLTRDNISLKKEKIICTFETKEDETLVPVSVPEGLTSLTIMKRGNNIWINCLPEKSKVYLEEGDYYNVRYEIVVKSDADTWKLSASRSGALKVDKNTAIPDVEPLTLEVTPTFRDNGKITLKPSLTAQGGTRIRIYKNNQMFPAPDLIIKDSEGNELARTTLKYG